MEFVLSTGLLDDYFFPIVLLFILASSLEFRSVIPLVVLNVLKEVRSLLLILIALFPMDILFNLNSIIKFGRRD